MTGKPKVMIALNTAWNIYNYRAGLIRALLAAGYEVIAAAPPDEYVPRLVELGCRFVPIQMDNQGTSILSDMALMWRFWRLLYRERPAVFLGYTIKPNIYGSLMASVLHIPVINNVAGLGTMFVRKNWLLFLVSSLYKFAFRKSACVFFQNGDDFRLFIDKGLVNKAQARLVPGSGVNLTHFISQPLADLNQRPFRFLLLARLLWEKGIGEYVEAARSVRKQFPSTEFQILGFLDVLNPGAISHKIVEQWVNEGIIQYLGATDDVRPFINAADCVVLPSFYMEGTPRSLLEASAMSRPVITTDWVGCRDVVDDGVNGYLCKPRDATDLAMKMKQMLMLPSTVRAEMGCQGRKKIEREFDEQLVIRKYMEMLAELELAHVDESR